MPDPEDGGRAGAGLGCQAQGAGPRLALGACVSNVCRSDDNGPYRDGQDENVYLGS